MAEINIRKGMPSVQLDKAEFKKRFLTQFYDPAFQPLQKELDKIAEAAWDGYDNYRKAPPLRPVRASLIPTMIFPSSGWRPARRSQLRNDGRKTRQRHRAF